MARAALAVGLRGRGGAHLIFSLLRDDPSEAGPVVRAIAAGNQSWMMWDVVLDESLETVVEVRLLVRLAS